MDRVQAATAETLQNAETEDENDQIVPIKDLSIDEDWVVKLTSRQREYGR